MSIIGGLAAFQEWRADGRCVCCGVLTETPVLCDSCKDGKCQQRHD